MRYFHVDAFTDRPFAGNPAGVMPVDAFPDDDSMLAMAAEHRHSETAWFVMLPDDPEADAHLRWFTPAFEVELCGHATLASAHVLRTHLGWAEERVVFRSRSGLLPVDFEGDDIVLNFPARTAAPDARAAAVSRAMGVSVEELLKTEHHLLCVFEDAQAVRTLEPDLAALAAFDEYGFIATAPGDGGGDAGGDGGYDVVSRFFAPSAGVPEDPVTGSAHCTIAPYWARRLGKDTLRCRQASTRGGDLTCTMAGGRVRIAGRAVTYLEGEVRA